jgi:acetoin:2,6-dichlorophenolindophenol oxidoreductase subunit alpha
VNLATEPPASGSLDAQQARTLVRTMLTVRETELAMIDWYKRNLIPGFIHPAIGEEAVHAGIALALDERDHVIGSHRNHGVVLARGCSPAGLLAEVLGRKDGLLGGRGGSLHAGDPTKGCLPASPLVGGGIAQMTGVALAHKLAGDGGVGVVAFGDGAANRGSYPEALNMAAIWDLPVIYAIIDNGWAISVPRTLATGGDLTARAAAYGVAAERVDGKDVAACADAAARAVARARAGDGPTVLVFDCPRGYGHEEGDAQEYRDRAEIAAAEARDPLELGIASLTAAGLITTEEVARMRSEVAAEIRAAAEFALASPLPDAEEAFRFVRPGEHREGTAA